MSEWFHRGQRVASISLDDRAVQYGDGVFETVAIRDGRPRMLARHIERLRRGADRLGIEMPAASSLESDLQQALSQTTLKTAYCVAKLIVSAGSGPRGYQRRDIERADAYIGLYKAQPLARRAYVHGVETLLTQSRIAIAPQLAGFKTLNRLDQVLARREWDTGQIFDGIMRDTDGRIICGTMTNVFIVNNNNIATPSLERCGVAGIMRSLIMDVLGESDLRCNTMDVRIDDLADADEVFLCNSQIGAVPVRRCDTHRWDVGETTRTVMALLAHSGVEECRL